MLRTRLISQYVEVSHDAVDRDLTRCQIDHFPDSARYAPHTNATFKQRYFFDSSYYKPGGPIYLYIGGETSGESRFSNLETGSTTFAAKVRN